MASSKHTDYVEIRDGLGLCVVNSHQNITVKLMKIKNTPRSS